MKRIIALTIITILCMTATPTYASDELNINQLSYLVYDSFSKGLLEQPIALEEYIPLCDVDGTLIGTCFIFKDEDQSNSYGYVITNFMFKSPISQYSYGSEKPLFDVFSSCDISIEKMVYISPFEYLFYADNGNVYDNTFSIVKNENLGKILELGKECKRIIICENGDLVAALTTGDYAAADDIYDLPGSYSTIESRNISGSLCYDESSFETNCGKYACAVVALTEIANSKGYYINNSKYDSFDELWDTTSTYIISYDYNKDCYYGATQTSQIGVGMVDFIEYLGGNCSYSAANNPSISTYKSAVNNQMPSTFSYGIRVNGSRSGHTVSVSGYLTVLQSSTVVDYLRVADGWNSTWAFLNFSQTSFLDKYAYIFTIN